MDHADRAHGVAEVPHPATSLAFTAAASRPAQLPGRLIALVTAYAIGFNVLDVGRHCLSAMPPMKAPAMMLKNSCTQAGWVAAGAE